MSNLQFRITPVSNDAIKAGNFKFFFKFPAFREWKKYDLRIKRITAKRNININFKPDNDIYGDCYADFHFTYSIGKDIYCFEQQILLHIHDNAHSVSSAINGGLNISIGSISQEGKAGDPNLNLLNGLYNSGKSLYNKLSSLKKDDCWQPLQLFQAIPLESEIKTIKKMFIPTPPYKKKEKLILKIGNSKILLFKNNITVGRSRETDLLLRNEPQNDDSWDLPKLQEMNLSINKFHCSIGIIDNMAVITDNHSTNGTFVNEERIAPGESFPLEYNTSYQISLASPFIHPKNIFLDIKVYSSSYKLFDDDHNNEIVPAGIVVRQETKKNISAVLINRWIPLSSVITDGGNYFITYKSGNFAVSDGKIWVWLESGVEFKINDKLGIVVE